MFANNNKISIRQLQSLIIINLLGSLLITLPRYAVANFSIGWLEVLIIGVVASLYGGLMSWIGIKIGEGGLNEFLYEKIGRFFSGVILLGFYVKIVIGGSILLRFLGEIINYNLLVNTPLWIVIISFALISMYCSYSGYECRGRLSEIMFYFVMLVLLIIFVFSARTVEVKTLVNSYDVIFGVNNITKGFLMFNGLELLIFAMPYMNNKKSVGKSVIISGLITTGIVVLITILVTAYFGKQNIENIVFPVVDMMSNVDFQFSFAQRQDVIVMGFFIAILFGSISTSLYFSAQIMNNNNERDFFWTLITAIIMVVLSLIPKNAVEVFAILDRYIYWLGTLYFVAMPFFIIVLLFVGKRR